MNAFALPRQIASSVTFSRILPVALLFAILFRLLADDPGEATPPSQGLLPVGTMVSFAGPPAAIPENEGWMLCDGRELSIQEHRALFDAIQYAWGRGTRAGTFRVPDLRGRFLRGVDGASPADIRDPDRDARLPAYPGGNSGNQVGSIQEDALARHSHTIIGAARATGITDGPGWLRFYSTNIEDDEVEDATTILPEGGSETRPRNAYVHWIIKVR